KQALQVTTETIQAQGIHGVKLTTINAEALTAPKRWDGSKIRQVAWGWVDGYGAFKLGYPRRLEVALGESRQLIGLSLGRPTSEAMPVALDFVEAAPLDLGDRPAIIEFVFLGYDIYARLSNAKEIRIMNPINKTVRAYYEEFGYSYISRGDYLF